jgi:choline dehydrogenase-like flavoprotein
MIHDLNTIDENILHCADLCIVGSGAAGIALAREFLHTNYRIVVLEAGGLLHEIESQDPYRSKVVGLPHTGVHDGRVRVFGGTTTLWAGQALPLSPIDFEARAWVPHSGWPVSFNELGAYYQRAEKVMKLRPSTYDSDAWLQSRRPLPDFNSEICEVGLSQFSNDWNFAVSYKIELRTSLNVHVVTHANVVNIAANKSASAVESLALKSLAGRTCSAISRYYIICCGGIETARLLLASNNIDPKGLGNRNDLVGRYFQEHLHCTPIPVTPKNKRRFAAIFNAFRDQNVKHAPKIAASTNLQRKHRILNIGAEIVYPPSTDSSIEAAKHLLRIAGRKQQWAEIPGVVGKLAKSPHKLAAAALRYYILRQPALDSTGQPYLGICGEQAPYSESRIYLGEDRDILGMRRAVVDWRLTNLERYSVNIFVKQLASEFSRLDLGRVELADFQWPDDPLQFGRVLHDSNHHMGTTRMSDSPKTGVVNSDCKVHDVNNLFIGSSSVFPTGGYSNPTLTTIALTIRLADHLKNLLNSTMQQSICELT